MFTAAAVICYFNSRPSARGNPAVAGALRRRLISIHAPPRGATRFAPPNDEIARFQFTPLREGQLHGVHQRPGTLQNFNSRPSARGNAMYQSRPANRIYFNSRPSARGNAMTEKHSAVWLFQFTPLREGQHYFPGDEYVIDLISIHAPPRGATHKVVALLALADISIHAPPRGATLFRGTSSSRGLFQFTPLREGRRRKCSGRLILLMISIHAPPRGATCCWHWQGQHEAISIHAPPRGATAKDMQFLQIFCPTLTNYRALAAEPCNLQGLFW